VGTLLGNLFLKTLLAFLGTLAWALLATCSWEPCLGTSCWEPLLGNLFLGTLPLLLPARILFLKAKFSEMFKI